MYSKFGFAVIILAGILAVGTVGYWLIGGPGTSFVDALYMTVITISTLGFGEVVNGSDTAGGRIFTMCIIVLGVGVLAYIATNLTAVVVEGNLTQSFRRRRMEGTARRYEDHYIVCGVESVGAYILNELRATKRPHVVVEVSCEKLEKAQATFEDEIFIEGDATDSDALVKAGVGKAKGLFAATGDDNLNLVITLTAKQLNPGVRVVAECSETRNGDKLTRAGADAVVFPSSIGGLRMASEMVRPTVVSFLDIMLRDKDKNLRVEEISVPDSFVRKKLSASNLKKRSHMLLLAIKQKGDWIYNPPDNYVVKPQDTLVFMISPEERRRIEEIFHSK